jgi:hypothetical protein
MTVSNTLLTAAWKALKNAAGHFRRLPEEDIAAFCRAPPPKQAGGAKRRMRPFS